VPPPVRGGVPNDSVNSEWAQVRGPVPQKVYS
jgi:hypothetical protein